jgi:hypothetical protein
MITILKWIASYALSKGEENYLYARGEPTKTWTEIHRITCSATRSTFFRSGGTRDLLRLREITGRKGHFKFLTISTGMSMKTGLILMLLYLLSS